MTVKRYEPHSIVAIDHLMISTFDHEVAVEAYTKLGFKVRPVRQLAPMGGGDAGGNGGSAAILLRSKNPSCANYLELARADPEKAMPLMKDILCVAEGPAMLVHATAEPDLLAQEWTNLGIDMQRVRLTLMPFGEGPPVELEVFLVPKGQAPVAFNACWYSDSYDFERDEWRDHPNGAVRWCGLSFPVDDVSFDSAVNRFTSIYGMDPDCAQDRAVFQLGDTHLTLWKKNAFRREHGQFSDSGLVHVAVSDMAVLLTLLADSDIPFARTGACVQVDAQFANGSCLLFEQAEK